MLAMVLQVPGNRHDVQGLHALLHEQFRGLLLADNAYTPGKNLDAQLRAQGVTVVAQRRKDARCPLPPETRKFVHAKRCRVERRIGLFDQQLSADRTLNRVPRHYAARRWFKALTHNLSRYINPALGNAPEQMLHFRITAAA